MLLPPVGPPISFWSHLLKKKQMLNDTVQKKECTQNETETHIQRENARPFQSPRPPPQSRPLASSFCHMWLLKNICSSSDSMGWSYYEGRETYGWSRLLLCVSEWVRVMGSFSHCSCSVSLNLSDGHWEAFLFFFFTEGLQWIPRPRMLVVKKCELSRRSVWDQERIDVCFSRLIPTFLSVLYGGPEMLKLKLNHVRGGVQCLVCGCVTCDVTISCLLA